MPAKTIGATPLIGSNAGTDLLQTVTGYGTAEGFKTDFSNELRTKVWSELVTRDAREKNVFAKFIGGEGSGHLLNLYNSPTGDGIVASLQVLVTMTRTGLPLKALASGYDPYPQVMKNVKVNDRDAALKSKKLSRKVDEFN